MKKRNLFFLILTLAGVGLFYLIAERLGWDKIREVFSIFHWWQFAFLIGLYFVSILFIALSMRIILKSLGYRLPFASLFALANINMAVGYLTPFAYLGGEPVQVYLMYKRHQIPVAVGTANVVLEKIGRQVIMMVFILIGVAWLVFNRALHLYWRVGLLALVIFLLFVLWAYFAKSISGEGFFRYMIKIFHLGKWKVLANPKVAPVIANIDERTSYFLIHHRKAFWTSLVFATGAELIPLVQMAFALWFMGLAPSFVSILLLFVFTNLLTMIPTPAQLGTFEISGISAFAIKGATASAGLIFSVFLHVVNIISVLPGLALVPIYGMTIKEAMFNGEDVQKKIKNDQLKIPRA